MKQKSTLLAVTLVVVAVFTVTAFAVENQHIDGKTKRAEAVKAGKSKAEKPVKRDGHMEEKTTTPKVMELRDWEELFGHKPMEEGNNMPMPEPASGASKQEAMQPMLKHDRMQEH